MVTRSYLLWFSILVCQPVFVFAQSYADSIQQFRKAYLKDLLAETRHPVSAADSRKIKFFTADKSYRVWADVTEVPDGKPFMIQTHSGKQKTFREYCTLTFSLKGSTYTLHAYQSVDMLAGGTGKDDLFLPFTDLTNYETTYGGGRYIDLSVKDIKDHRILLDFNKCYNPYCAYSDGFSCPIPPDENSLHVEITAGEKAFPR